MFELASWVFFLVQPLKKEEGEHTVSKRNKRTKEEIEEARQCKIKKKEEEEQNRWRWLGKRCSFHLVLTWTTHTLKHITTLGKAKCSNFHLIYSHFFCDLAFCQVGRRKIWRRGEMEVPWTHWTLLPSWVPASARQHSFLLWRSAEHKSDICQKRRLKYGCPCNCFCKIVLCICGFQIRKISFCHD